MARLAGSHSSRLDPCGRATESSPTSSPDRSEQRVPCSSDSHEVTRFDASDSLIIVRAWLWGPRGKAKLDLAFDTAATHTHIVPDIVDELGYSPLQGEAITSVQSALGREPGYLMESASTGYSA